MSTLQLRGWDLYAISQDGLLVYLGTTASFFEWGAERCGERRVLHMTKLDRAFKNLSKKPVIVVQEQTVDTE